MLTRNALKNLMQSFELVVTLYRIQKTSLNTHKFCEWVCINARSVKSWGLFEGFSASLGLSEGPQFKGESDFILKAQNTGKNEVISSFNLSRKTGNLTEQSSYTKMYYAFQDQIIPLILVYLSPLCSRKII